MREEHISNPALGGGPEPAPAADYLSQAGAELLAQTIRGHWADHPGLRVWIEPDRRHGCWVVRSNLGAHGSPPTPP
jgi:hypothetical protein